MGNDFSLRSYLYHNPLEVRKRFAHLASLLHLRFSIPERGVACAFSRNSPEEKNAFPVFQEMQACSPLSEWNAGGVGETLCAGDGSPLSLQESGCFMGTSAFSSIGAL